MQRRSRCRGDSWYYAARILIITISCAAVVVHFFFTDPLAHNSVQKTITSKSKIADLPLVNERNNDDATTPSDSATKEKKPDGIEKQIEGVDTGSTLNEAIITLNNTSPSTLCRQVYFWGGGKAGSSTLYFVLTQGPGGGGNPTNTGPFVRGLRKEPCQGSQWKRWEALTKDTNLCHGGSDSNSFTHILNGCPRETSVQYARKAIALSDDPKFLMLIRDPVDRFVSFLNDEVRRFGSRMNIEEAAKRPSGLGRRLAMQGEALKNLLSVVKDPKQILIIPMESISLNAEGVIDAIMDHVDGRRWKRNETEVMNPNSLKVNVGSTDDKYVTLSQNTTEILRNKFRQDVQLLESLVGKRFSWSSWARNEDANSTGEEEEAKNEAWLVASPASG